MRVLRHRALLKREPAMDAEHLLPPLHLLEALDAATLQALGSRPLEPRAHAHLEHCLSCRLRQLQASRATDAAV